MNTLEFFEAIFQGSDRGFSQIISFPSMRATPIPIDDFSGLDVSQGPGEEVYFSPGITLEPKSEKLCADDVDGITCLWIDVDMMNPGAHKKANLPASVAEAMTLLPDDLPPSIVVHSGYGLHVYWLLREPWYFDSPEEKLEASKLLIRLQAYIRSKATGAGWHVDSTSNLDRILRVPGTKNNKNKKFPVDSLVIESCDARYNQSDIEELIPEIDIETGERIRRTSFERRPTDGPAALMVSNCAFMLHAQINAKTLAYSEWVAVLTNLTRANDGIDAAHAISALDTERYDKRKTDRKIDEVLGSMHPMGCEYIRRDLGFQGCPASGCDIKSPCVWSLGKVPKARALVKSIIIPTPEIMQDREMMGALAVLQKERPVDFDVFKQRCKGQLNTNVLHTELKRIRAEAANLIVHEGGNKAISSPEYAEDGDGNPEAVPGSWLSQVVPDVPINLRIPPMASGSKDSWRFQASGVTLIRFTTTGTTVSRASHVPVLITKRILNIDTDLEKAEVTFKTLLGWRSVLLPKSTIFSSKSIMCLTNYGLTLDEDMGKNLSKWLPALQAANEYEIPLVKSVPKLGWRKNQTEFALPGIPSSYQIDSLVESSGMIEAIGPIGSFDIWKENMEHIRQSPRGRFILAASFAAPLLRIIDKRSFTLHNWGDSEDGKSATLYAALSVWGRPNILRMTFNTTQTALEKYAEFFTDLPLGINEYEIVNDRRTGVSNAETMVYMLSEERGRQRANKDGSSQPSATWRTIAICNGESPISKPNSKIGMLNRLLEFHGGPLPGDTEFSKALYGILDKNAGHAGNSYVMRLLAADHGEIRSIFLKTTKALRAKFPGSLDAHVDAVGCIMTADYLSSQWIFDSAEEEASQKSVEMGIRILEELIKKSEANEFDRAWDWLMDWLSTNKQRFEISNQTTIKVIGDVYGVDEIGSIHVIKSVLSEALREAGYSPEKLYRQWAKEGKFSTSTRPDGRKEYGKKRRIGSSVAWVLPISKALFVPDE